MVRLKSTNQEDILIQKKKDANDVHGKVWQLVGGSIDDQEDAPKELFVSPSDVHRLQVSWIIVLQRMVLLGGLLNLSQHSLLASISLAIWPL